MPEKLLIEANVSGFTFDLTGQFCLIYFFSIKGDDFIYYTIMPSEQIHAMGAIPACCELELNDTPPAAAKLFKLKSNTRYAKFVSVPYYARQSNKPAFWYFNLNSKKDH